jgi:amidohydrolase
LAQVTAAGLKQRVNAGVESLGEELASLSQHLRSVPELGFAEWRTRDLVRDWLTLHGIAGVRDVALTGLRVDVSGAVPGPTVALLGELDAVHVPGHPDADPRTGAAHACGHHASLAAACGAFLAVSQVMPDLAGRLSLIGTPAEEMLPDQPGDEAQPCQDRMPTGKAELIRLSAFDDVDMAMMVHTGREAGPRFSVGDTLNAALRMRAVFRGTAAHAGSSPWLGVDAVRAARLAMDAVDAQWVLFPDSETVRIAQQIHQSQAAPGATAERCHLEVLVRARTLATLELAADRIDRALYSGAVAIGAGLTRTSELVYAPVRSSAPLDAVVEANAVAVLGDDVERTRGRHLGASSDIGDLGLLMPVSHPYASGAVGHHHSPSFRVTDHRQATVEPASYLATTVVDLLHGDARVARDVLTASPPALSRTDYLDLRRRMSHTRDSWPQLTRNTDDTY